MQSVFELGLDELDAIVQKLPKTGVIVLRGDLASGKTTLTKAIVASFGIKANVTSPTFSIMQNYENIYHYDIYQNGFEGLKANGLFENLFEDGLHIVEWGDENLVRLLKKYGIDVCIVDITAKENKRIYEVSFA
ncbi:tRNA (adenosine(37)-N6)-threonylcarbamoyltransferase complex ATPase subunit type 1 TsaE [Campylobacter hyointestinalis]|uniref:tRNA threonylcarbamoyladenosine biosynthesis protein TsaE n=1 Tax=Campylobacter hyointestinalis subsp. hyointestinalis TaxID=91352 RepID=A0A855N150_CAMHY|nr:tRNA (adenosine(37)-N6)-threonylcarbamoyltransferase complex ATPase subunit type 1 TsaE [Campylobacter hyointestinalis]ANE32621.1 N6-L-threonylcarbamoyladenine synthase, TsaE subunit [Campylobacter hyointestinalis subsp. hyointestinalis LMG 9260]KEA45040.1 ATP-binding protein [Campylobacter hyointestinalis subsp. hyointestinalis]MBT0612730.1 tRNA (adenosine(37)-N6)-threonylcarbamoyltransferase complex ATPase subunit type 1 TsaE [Campylobacter hyointestinalis subsp. hyointestinalis]MDL2346796